MFQPLEKVVDLNLNGQWRRDKIALKMSILHQSISHDIIVGYAVANLSNLVLG